jgi:hypothetical protein
MVDLEKVMAAKTGAEKVEILIAVMQEAQKISDAQRLSDSKPLTKEQLMEKVVPGIGSTNVDKCPLIPLIIWVIILIIVIRAEQ